MAYVGLGRHHPAGYLESLGAESSWWSRQDDGTKVWVGIGALVGAWMLVTLARPRKTRARANPRRKRAQAAKPKKRAAAKRPKRTPKRFAWVCPTGRRLEDW